MKKQGCIIFF